MKSDVEISRSRPSFIPRQERATLPDPFKTRYPPEKKTHGPDPWTPDAPCLQCIISTMWEFPSAATPWHSKRKPLFHLDGLAVSQPSLPASALGMPGFSLELHPGLSPFGTSFP